MQSCIVSKMEIKTSSALSDYTNFRPTWIWLKSTQSRWVKRLSKLKIRLKNCNTTTLLKTPSNISIKMRPMAMVRIDSMWSDRQRLTSASARRYASVIIGVVLVAVDKYSLDIIGRKTKGKRVTEVRWATRSSRLVWIVISSFILSIIKALRLERWKLTQMAFSCQLVRSLTIQTRERRWRQKRLPPPKISIIKRRVILARGSECRTRGIKTVTSQVQGGTRRYAQQATLWRMGRT